MSTLELLSSTEAATRLGVARSTVINYVNRGMMYPAAMVDTGGRGSYVFTPDEIERVRDQREAGIK